MSQTQMSPGDTFLFVNNVHAERRAVAPVLLHSSAAYGGDRQPQGHEPGRFDYTTIPPISIFTPATVRCLLLFFFPLLKSFGTFGRGNCEKKVKAKREKRIIITLLYMDDKCYSSITK